MGANRLPAASSATLAAARDAARASDRGATQAGLGRLWRPALRTQARLSNGHLDSLRPSTVPVWRMGPNQPTRPAKDQSALIGRSLA